MALCFGNALIEERDLKLWRGAWVADDFVAIHHDALKVDDAIAHQGIFCGDMSGQ